MDFKFYLDHDVLGTLEISPPDGWKDLVLRLERDKNFHSLVEYFDGSFIFYGDNGIINGGIDRILEVERDYGPDAKLIFRSTVSMDGYSYEDLYEGLMQLFGIIQMPDNKIQVPVIQNDLWTKFITRLDTPVNVQSELSLDDVDVNNFDSINLKLTSQKIQKKTIGYETEASDEWVRNGVNNTFELDDYIQLSFSGNRPLEEIDTFFTLPIAINPDIPAGILIADYAGDYNFEIQIGIFTVSGDIGDIEFLDSSTFIEFYIQKNEESPILLTHSVESYPGIIIPETGETDTLRLNLYNYNDVLSLNVGDDVKVYGKIISISFGGTQQQIILATNEYEVGNSFCFDPFNPTDCIDYPSIIGLDRTFIKVTAQTVFPETNAFGFFIHDLGGQILDRIVSENDRFYSEHLGSDRTLYRQYNGDGCAWKYAAAKGLQIRQYSLIEKPFFMSFNQWWKGVNPVLCLGLGYDEIDGVQVIRVEKMEDFYDTSVSVYINNVRQISRNYDQDVIFKTVKVGYSKWQSEDISGIDDAQTTHTYATRLQKSGNDLNIESDFIAASLAIETTRRTNRIKSADYKYDNETFLIALNPIPIDVSPVSGIVIPGYDSTECVNNIGDSPFF